MDNSNYGEADKAAMKQELKLINEALAKEIEYHYNRGCKPRCYTIKLLIIGGRYGKNRLYLYTYKSVVSAVCENRIGSGREAAAG